MAITIKETPILKGKNAQTFLEKIVKGPTKISAEELKKREKNFKALEKIRKF